MPELKPASLTDLRDLWTRLLGNPPEPDQFVWWATHFSDEVIKYGIQRVAAKNLAMSGKMTLAHRDAYATKVMRARVEETRQVTAMKARNITSAVDIYLSPCCRSSLAIMRLDI